MFDILSVILSNIFHCRGQFECVEAQYDGDGTRWETCSENQEKILSEGDEQTNQIVSNFLILSLQSHLT